MTRAVWFLVLVGTLFTTGGALAVEPAYLGPLGNPEEPAMRPYKWLWHGIGSLFYQTEKSVEYGNMKTPILGTVEGFRGLRRGAVELGESAYKGVIFAPVPREEGSYKTTGKGNQAIENDPFARNASDFAFSLVAFPLLIAHDRWSVEEDEQAAERQKKAEEIRAARKAARSAANRRVSDMERAQRKYIGRRADAGGKPKDGVPENLLKLAK